VESATRINNQTLYELEAATSMTAMRGELERSRLTMLLWSQRSKIANIIAISDLSRAKLETNCANFPMKNVRKEGARRDMAFQKIRRCDISA
jgi:hypothetical protein